MDELLREFLTETTEHLEGAENQLVQFERDPTDASLIASIFRLVHTIKGTSSFLSLDRLEHVAHAAETLLGAMREGAPPTRETVSLILAAIDRIKVIIDEVEGAGAELPGDDTDVTDALEAHMASNLQGTSGHKTAKAPAEEISSIVEVTELCLPEGDNGAEDDDAEAHHAAEMAASEYPPVMEMSPVADPMTSGLMASGLATPELMAPGLMAPGLAAARAEKKQDQDKHDHAGKGQGNAGAAKASETIRVAVDTIERIMQLVSELVLTRNQLLELTRHRDDDAVKSPLQRLSALTTDLQDAVMRARMQPVGRLFGNLPRLVRELCSELGKKIDLVTEGADTELDRQLIEVIRDPLTHIIRNCADHGIESPEIRVMSGKSETGEIRVSASHEAGQITIDISDDGRGLNTDRIRKKVIANGLAAEQDVARMTDEEVQHYIFEPGFSTAEKVTSTSGRGVGMDVVRSNIESIGGSVSLKSLPGRGSRFSLKIPLTLAIAPALIIKVADQRYALPQHAVVEAVGLGKNSSDLIDKVQNALVLKLRDEVIPVVDLRSILGLDDNAGGVREGQLVVIMRVGPNSFGVIVDEVSDIQEIVVKPLSASIAHLKVFSGHTILGDGSVVLILDPGGIAVNLGIEKSAEKKHEAAKEGYAAPDKTRLILFRAGPGPQKVLPLSLISRIEMVEPNRIEQLDGRYMILHQGRLMPVMPVSMSTDVTAKAHPVLVTTVDQGAVGLLVEEIVDVIEEKLDVQLASAGAELVGSAEIKGEGVELLDISYFLQAAYPANAQQPGSKGNRVLLVDDESFFRDMLSPALTAGGYAVTAVNSAEEALEMFAQGAEFNAVVVDTDMPGMSGYQLAHRLRQAGLPNDFPIIGLIAHPSPGAMQSAQEHGMTMGVGKLDRLSLLSALNSILEQAGQDQHMSTELAA